MKLNNLQPTGWTLARHTLKMAPGLAAAANAAAARR